MCFKTKVLDSHQFRFLSFPVYLCSKLSCQLELRSAKNERFTTVKLESVVQNYYVTCKVLCIILCMKFSQIQLMLCKCMRQLILITLTILTTEKRRKFKIGIKSQRSNSGVNIIFMICILILLYKSCTHINSIYFLNK